MRKSKLVSLMLFIPMIVCAADKPIPLNVKTGNWKMTYTVGATGQMPVSDKSLAELSPEMRARMEKLWKERTSNATQTNTIKRCVTEEDLKRSAFANDTRSCTNTVLASSSTALDVREECASDDSKKITTYHLRASTPESVTGGVDLEMSASGRTMKVKGTFTGKWLGAGCEDAK